MVRIKEGLTLGIIFFIGTLLTFAYIYRGEKKQWERAFKDTWKYMVLPYVFLAIPIFIIGALFA